MPIRPFRSAKRGFTLVELLASIAIASILMIVLLGFMQQSSSTYQETQRAVTTLSDARAFLKFFESELSSRLPGTPLISTPGGDGDKIAFVRAQSYDEQKSDTGDLQTSMYYTAFTKDTGAGGSPKLFRHSLDAKDTQKLIETSLAANPAMPSPTINLDEPILYNVVTFKAQPKYYDGAGEAHDWSPTNTEKPDFMEVVVGVVDDGTAARFPAESSWARLRDPNSNDAKKYVRTYKRTIQLSK